jgi:hypothetical protein
VKESHWNQMKEEIKRANQNYIDDDFKISTQNKFVKIIDFSLDKEERFMNLFPQTCFQDL